MFKIIDDNSNQFDNLAIDVFKASPKTFQVLDEAGKQTEATLNVLKRVEKTTLSDLKRSVSDKEIAVSQAAERLQVLQQQLDDLNLLISEVEKEMDKLPAREVADVPNL